jgi:hypothetical protein
LGAFPIADLVPVARLFQSFPAKKAEKFEKNLLKNCKIFSGLFSATFSQSL